MEQTRINQLSNEIYTYCRSYLREMVGIYSTSLHEKKLAEYIVRELASMGIEAYFTPVGEEGANVEASICGAEPGPVIGFAGHLDTVPIVEGWETDPLVVTEKDGKLYGLGTCDMKMGNAMILAFAKVITKHKLKFCGTLRLYFVSDEEGYSAGAKQMLTKALNAESIYMLEANYDKAITGAVGKALIQVTVRGKACHAAWPKEGVNAIEEASKLIAALDRIKLTSHPFLDAQPFVTLSMKGGYETYSLTVPELCTFTLNKHLVPGEDVESVLKKLRELVQELNLRAQVEFELMEPYYAAYELPEECGAIVDLKAAYRKVLGKELETEYGEGVSDANCFFSLGGVNTVNFGPRGGNMHCANEWLDLETLRTAIQIYVTLLESKMSLVKGV